MDSVIRLITKSLEPLIIKRQDVYIEQKNAIPSMSKFNLCDQDTMKKSIPMESIRLF